MFDVNVLNLNTSVDIRQIEIEKLVENEKNFFRVEEDIIPLAENIQSQGLLQPLVVVEADDGTYRVIAGHRRLKALRYLHEQDPEHWHTALCNVTKPGCSEAEELMLIQTNTTTRELSWQEKNDSAKKVEELLLSLGKQGVKFPGRMRTHVAKIMKTSEAAIARAKVIDKHLISEFKKAAKTNATYLGESVCYKLAQMPEERQREVYERKYKNAIYSLTGSWIDAYNQAKDEGKDSFAVSPNVRYCYCVNGKNGKYPECSADKIIEERNKNEKLLPVERCESTCCNSCINRAICPDCCETAKKKIKTSKGGLVLGARLLKLREEAGVSRQECFEVDKYYVGFESGFYSDLSGTTLSKFAKLFHCTTDAILGLSPTEPVPSTYWHTVKNKVPPFGREILIIYGKACRCRRVVYKLVGDQGKFYDPSCLDSPLSIEFFDVKYWCYLPEGI